MLSQDALKIVIKVAELRLNRPQKPSKAIQDFVANAIQNSEGKTEERLKLLKIWKEIDERRKQ